jgi:hypothetical protein
MARKNRSLSGARIKITASKTIVSRSASTGQFVKASYAKRNPGATITQKIGSSSWETRSVRPDSPPPRGLEESYQSVELIPILGRPSKEPEAPDSALRRLVAAVERHVKSLDLTEVERANGSMDAVAERMLASIPGANVLDDRVGPFYDTAGLKAWFDISKQALDVQARAGHVICVLSADGFRLYPSFQFDERGTRLPRLREVLAGLDPEQVDTWGDAVWLNAPAEELDGLTPAETLRTNRADEVVRLAQQAGAFRLG